MRDIPQMAVPTPTGAGDNRLVALAAGLDEVIGQSYDLQNRLHSIATRIFGERYVADQFSEVKADKVRRDPDGSLDYLADKIGTMNDILYHLRALTGVLAEL